MLHEPIPLFLNSLILNSLTPFALKKQFLVAVLFIPLSAFSFGGDVLMVVKGQVTTMLGAGINTGPFAGASPGDSIEYRIELQTPGQPSGTDSEWYDHDVERTEVRMGSNVIANPMPGSTPQFVIANDATSGGPVEDSVRGSLGFNFEWRTVFGIQLPSNTFATTDLTQVAGLYPLGSGASGEFTDWNWFDGFLIDFSELEIIVLGTIGTSYCSSALPNSTGLAGFVESRGTTRVQYQRTEIEALQLPANQIGFFIGSQTQGLVMNPGNYQGALCLGGAIGRFDGPGQVQSSGAAGRIALELDWTQIPQPTGPVMAQAGETWNIQLWHRDANPGPTSHFTNAVSLLLD